jgi:hypothetical protein
MKICASFSIKAPRRPQPDQIGIMRWDLDPADQIQRDDFFAHAATLSRIPATIVPRLLRSLSVCAVRTAHRTSRY